MATQFEFVLAGDFGKPTPKDRRLIRSRCMQGKNQRIGSRRSKQQEKLASKVQPKDFVKAIQKDPYEALPNTYTVDQTIEMQQQLVLAPLAPPSDFSLLELPGELGLHSDEILYKCT